MLPLRFSNSHQVVLGTLCWHYIICRPGLDVLDRVEHENNTPCVSETFLLLKSLSYSSLRCGLACNT